MVVLLIEQGHGVIRQKLSFSGNQFFNNKLSLSFLTLATHVILLLMYRFCPQLSEDIAMDEKDDVKLVKVLWETKVDMVRNSSKVSKLAQLLK